MWLVVDFTLTKIYFLLFVTIITIINTISSFSRFHYIVAKNVDSLSIGFITRIGLWFQGDDNKFPVQLRKLLILWLAFDRKRKTYPGWILQMSSQRVEGTNTRLNFSWYTIVILFKNRLSIVWIFQFSKSTEVHINDQWEFFNATIDEDSEIRTNEIMDCVSINIIGSQSGLSIILCAVNPLNVTLCALPLKWNDVVATITLVAISSSNWVVVTMQVQPGPDSSSLS